MSNAWPTADEVAVLFERFVQGDCVSQSDLIAAVLDPLVSHLKSYRREADEHLCLTAAEDAVLSVSHRPSIFDKTRCGLLPFLRMAAERDLLNALARERRHQSGREILDCVELAEDGRNASRNYSMADLPSFDDPLLAAEIASLTDVERQVLQLMREGERRTSAFAAVMAIGHLPETEQAREVKRCKDRIIKRLQRAGGKA